jgi:hypothetical protein
MILGNGAYRFEWIDNFARLPAGKSFGKTHGIVTDARDNVYVFHTGAEPLCVFDSSGTFISSWGNQFVEGAHGLYLSKEGGTEFLWLVDYLKHAVVKTTLDGKEVLRLDPPNRPDIYKSLDEYKPTDVCVAPDGTVFVFDGYGKSWIHRYDKSGRSLDSFAGDGQMPPWRLGRYARSESAGALCRRSRQQSYPEVYARWKARRFRDGRIAPAVLLFSIRR